MNKAQLQHRVKELEMELLETKINKNVIVKNVLVPESRKIKTFSGLSSCKLSIDEWVDDIDLIFSARKYTDSEKVDFIYSHLEGQAKEEIKYRSDIRHDPDAILHCLRTAFGSPESLTTLQQKFFERQQENSESLRQYSYVLLELFQSVIRKDSGVFPNKELTLCEKFANGLQDQYIRREANPYKKLL